MISNYLTLFLSQNLFKIYNSIIHLLTLRLIFPYLIFFIREFFL